LTVVIHYKELSYRKLEDLKIEMVGRATNNARERAKKIAKEGRFRLGSIADVRIGVFQITPIHSYTYIQELQIAPSCFSVKKKTVESTTDESETAK